MHRYSIQDDRVAALLELLARPAADCRLRPLRCAERRGP